MEAAQLETYDPAKRLMGAPNSVSIPTTPPTQMEHCGSPKFVVPSSYAKRKVSTVNNQVSLEMNTHPSVSTCYIFKSRLQEYAQKAGILTPIYDTIKEGPSHEPSFRSTVILNNIRYDSLPGFFNRKTAEQSAAEVALVELANSVDIKFGISLPVHQTGLCKNLLQEYAQKMNYAIPVYECHLEEKPGTPMYSCVLEIGGIKYIGASASTKKEAEIKVARTALLAIQGDSPSTDDHANYSIYTVVPQKKKFIDIGKNTQETAEALQPKKNRFKNSWMKNHAFRKHKSAKGKMTQGDVLKENCQIGLESIATGAVSASSQLSGGIDPPSGQGAGGTEVGCSQVQTPIVSEGFTLTDGGS